MRSLWLVLLIAAACAAGGRAFADEAIDAPLTEGRWSFVVISDLHQPDNNQPSRQITALVAAVLAEQPRFVVIAGDSTNGNLGDSPQRVFAMRARWHTLLEQLEPLRRAGIAVLPIAGNHDAILPGYRADYAEAFSDLDHWAYPLVVDGTRQPPSLDGDVALDAVPFSYSVQLRGVHVSLTYVVDRSMRPQIARWLADDLARARDASMRIVVGHVPLASVMTTPSPIFLDAFGGVLAAGGVTAYIAGHEHLVWDEVVPVRGGAIRQILVGTGIGTYNYGPSPAAMKRAHCEPVIPQISFDRYRCHLPESGLAFTLHDGWNHRLLQHFNQTYTVFTVDGNKLTARPVAVTQDGMRVAFE